MFLYRKELWAFYRPYLRRLVADLFCALVASVFALLIPLLVRYFTETLLDSGFFFWQLALAGGVILLCIALQAACTYYMDAKGHELGARMERDVRQSLFAHCQRLSFSFYDERRAAEIMSRLTSDSLLLTEFFHHFPEDLVVNGVKFIGAAVILVGLNWQLAALIFCLLPFMLAYTLHFNKKMRRAYRQIYRKIADVNAQAEDSLQGIRTVQSFANEGLEEEKFGRENQSFFENRSEGYRSEAVLDTGAKAFAQIILLCVLLYGGVLLARGALSLPDLLVFLLYISYFTSPIEQLVHMTQQYQEGVTGFSRYLEIMRETPQVSDLPGAREAGELRGDIQFCNVAFRYGQGPDILKGVDFSIRAGEYDSGYFPLYTKCRFFHPGRGICGVGRRFGRGKDDAMPADRALLRCAAGRCFAGWGGCARHEAFLFAQADWHCAAGNVPFFRDDCGKYRLWKAWSQPGGD